MRFKHRIALQAIEMDAQTIDHALKSDLCCKKYYKNTLSCDQLPKIVKNSLYIINLSESWKNLGSHWVVCCSIPSNDYDIALCCSGGSQIHENKYIQHRVLEYSNNYYAFDKVIQDSNDTACGSISLVISWLLCRHVSAKNILNRFFKNVSSEAYIRDLFACHLAFCLFDIKRGTVASMFLDENFKKKVKNAKKNSRKKKLQSIKH